MDSEEMEPQALEEICYPINDVMLSSSSDIVNIQAISQPPARTRGKGGRKPAANRQKNLLRPSGGGGGSHSTTIPVILPEVDYYSKHLLNHTAKALYPCNQCNKTFKNQSTLNSHKVSHTMAMPFTCEVCQKSFNRLSTLKSHRNIHSGNKPFSCHVCQKAFYQKGNLKNHLNIHTNERPYRCDICSRGFNQMSNLVCHKRNAHWANTFEMPEYPPYCRFCAIQFETPAQLAAHEAEMHFQSGQSRKPTGGAGAAALETETQLVKVQTFIDEADPEMKDIEVLVDDDEGEVVDDTETREDVKPILGHASSTDGPLIESDPLAYNPSAQQRQQKNCQMVFEKTESHVFFSRFSVIELPQKIDTLEMKYAEMKNKTPFAMLHFGDDIPCLVEIIQQRGMSILKPIKKHELGHLTFTEPDPEDVAASSKIVITIVATILQSFTKGEYSLFTVKSPEIVKSVKLLVDSDQVRHGTTSSFTDCVKAEELMELKNKITIAMTDCQGAITRSVKDADMDTDTDGQVVIKEERHDGGEEY